MFCSLVGPIRSLLAPVTRFCDTVVKKEGEGLIRCVNAIKIAVTTQAGFALVLEEFGYVFPPSMWLIGPELRSLPREMSRGICTVEIQARRFAANAPHQNTKCSENESLAMLDPRGSRKVVHRSSCRDLTTSEVFHLRSVSSLNLLSISQNAAASSGFITWDEV